MSEEYYRTVFMENLNFYLSFRQKKQSDLCKDLNLSKSTVSSWCTGKKIPRMDKIELLANYLKIDKSDLIEERKTSESSVPNASEIARYNTSKLCKRIKQRREELGMSQEELANKLGYKSRSTINKIEMGINDITQSKIKAFADALQTTPGYLMGMEDNTSQPLLNDKDEKDIARVLSNTLEKLSYNSEALMFDGEALDSETQELLKNSLENALRMGKVIAKQKYNPKKNQK